MRGVCLKLGASHSPGAPVPSTSHTSHRSSLVADCSCFLGDRSVMGGAGRGGQQSPGWGPQGWGWPRSSGWGARGPRSGDEPEKGRCLFRSGPQGWVRVRKRSGKMAGSHFLPPLEVSCVAWLPVHCHQGALLGTEGPR